MNERHNGRDWNVFVHLVDHSPPGTREYQQLPKGLTVHILPLE